MLIIFLLALCLLAQVKQDIKGKEDTGNNCPFLGTLDDEESSYDKEDDIDVLEGSICFIIINYFIIFFQS